MKYKLNLSAIITLIIAGVIFSSLFDMVGNIPECNTDPYTLWQVLQVGLSLIIVWALGFFAKFSKSER